MNRKALIALRVRLNKRLKALRAEYSALNKIEDREWTPEEEAREKEISGTIAKHSARLEQVNDDLIAMTRSADPETEDDEDDDEAPAPTEDDEDDEDDDEAPAQRNRNRPAPARTAPAPSRRGQSDPMPGVRPQGPAVHTRDHRYSYLAALRMSYEMTTRGRQFSGIEAEVHQHLESARRSITSEPAHGILLPLGTEPELQRHLNGRQERRDLTTTTGAGTIYTKMALPFIELLRSNLVLADLGASFMSGLVGPIAFPRQSGAATAFFAGEQVAVSPSNPTFDQVGMSPKLMTTLVPISRSLIYQSSFDVEAKVKTDLAQVSARKLENVAINGPGGTSPLGILQNSGITTFSASVQGGTNGAIPTFAQIVRAETLVASANAAKGSLKWLTTPGVKGVAKVTPKIGSTYPIYLMGDDGLLNTYPVLTSTEVPSNLTKGSASGICHAAIFANWASLMIGQWGGIDTLVNPYTDQASGDIRVSMYMNVDVAVDHNESFAAIRDLLVA